MANPYSMLSFLAAFIYIFLIMYVVPKDIRPRVKYPFVFLCLSMSVWSAAYAFVYPASALESTNTLWFWYRLSSLGWCLLPAFILHFSLALTGFRGWLNHWYTLFLVYTPAVINLYQVWTGYLVVKGFRPYQGILLEVSNNGSLWQYSHPLLLIVYFCIACLVVWIWARESPFRHEKIQARIILTVGCITMAIGMLTNILAPFLQINIPAVAHILTLGLAVAMWWVMLKHRFLMITTEIVVPKILEYVSEMVFLADQGGRITYFNHPVELLTGYPASELEHLSIADLTPEPQQVSNCIQRLSKTGLAGDTISISCKTRSGDSLPVEMDITPVVISGATAGYVIVARDMRPTLLLEQEILEKARAEEAMRESETLYRELFHNTNDLIYVHDLNGIVISMNPASVNILGYEPEELIGTDIFDLVIPEHKELALKMLHNKLVSDQVTWYDLSVIHKNGQHVFLELSTRLHKKDGLPVAVQGTARDVTERKQIEDRLRHFSMHDAITGLYNRAYFNEEMQRMSSGRHLPVGLIICDLDGLKLVNDYLGHDVGDKMLVTAARLIEDCFRQEDTVARVGGDEFGIILPESPVGIVSMAADRILEAVEAYNKSLPRIPLSISVGWSVLSDLKVSMNELFKNADNHMYQSKYTDKTFTYKHFLEDRLRSLTLK